uniref:Uncharacterized protein n=1 Tax=Sphaerodactylus townsendi TaxID=933632 RepID=A0ACB8EMB6_9SAUR
MRLLHRGVKEALTVTAPGLSPCGRSPPYQGSTELPAISQAAFPAPGGEVALQAEELPDWSCGMELSFLIGGRPQQQFEMGLSTKRLHFLPVKKQQT